jgi:hypothetical protein
MTKKERFEVASGKVEAPRRGPGKYSKVNAASREFSAQQVQTATESINGNGHIPAEGVLFSRLSRLVRRNDYDGRPAKPNRALAFKGR